jgi:hypothetical protein
MATVHHLSRQDARRVDMTAEVDQEIADLATWLGLELRVAPEAEGRTPVTSAGGLRAT